MKPTSLMLGAALASLVLSPAQAQMYQYGDPMGAAMGSAMQAQIRSQAQIQWSGVDPKILSCLNRTMTPKPNELAAQGIMPSAPDIQGYFNACERQIAAPKPKPVVKKTVPVEASPQPVPQAAPNSSPQNAAVPPPPSAPAPAAVTQSQPAAAPTSLTAPVPPAPPAVAATPVAPPNCKSKAVSEPFYVAACVFGGVMAHGQDASSAKQKLDAERGKLSSCPVTDLNMIDRQAEMVGAQLQSQVNSLTVFEDGLASLCHKSSSQVLQ